MGDDEDVTVASGGGSRDIGLEGKASRLGMVVVIPYVLGGMWCWNESLGNCGADGGESNMVGRTGSKVGVHEE